MMSFMILLNENLSSDSEEPDNVPPDPISLPAECTKNLKDLQWEDYGSTDKRCTAFPFTGNPGIKVEIQDYNDLYELFKLYVTDELVENIVEQTNKYAEQFLGYRPLRAFSRYRAWKPTDRDEIFVLLAFYILLGLIWKPVVDKYYTRKPIFSTPGFANLIPLSRLKLGNRFLHFADNATSTNRPKKLQKIWPIIDYLSKRFVDVYTPSKEVSVDESLLLWKGRLSFMQFIRINRARFGIKSYILSEAKSGYIWKLIVYVGNEIGLMNRTTYGHGTNVVLTIMDGLLDKGYAVYTDNFYYSPELALALNVRKTDLVGTVRSGRKGLPKNVVKTKLEKGESVVSIESKSRVMYVKWADKREVSLLSTCHEHNYKEVTRRGKAVTVPEIVNDYNIFMGGVDRVDQMLSAYPIERKKQRIWYKKRFRHLLNMSIYNAHTRHGKCGGKMTSLEFREALIERMVSQHLDENRNVKKGRPPNEEGPLRLLQRHFPDYVPATEKKQFPTKRCAVCSKHNQHKESRYQCTECGVGLCAVPCFKMYPTRKHY